MNQRSRLLLTELSHGVMPVSESKADARKEAIAQARFAEAVLTADEVLVAVHGPNLELAALVRWVGINAVLQLLDAGTLRFVYLPGTTAYVTLENTRVVLRNVEPGLRRVFGMTREWQDPHQAAVFALSRQTDVGGVRASHLARRATAITTVLDADVQTQALLTARQHLGTSLTAGLGIDPDEADAGLLKQYEQRAYLAVASHEIDVSMAAHGGATDFYVEGLGAELLARRLRGLIVSAKPETEGLREIMRAESIPDFESLISSGSVTISEVVALSQTENAGKFRAWLRDCTEEKPAVAAYYDALGAAGPLEGMITKPMRFMAMALLGGTLTPAAALGLSVIDTFLLDHLVKRWTPRAFIDDLRARIPGGH